MIDRRPVVVGVTGASGIVYGERLVENLLAREVPVELVISSAGRHVAREELGRDFASELDPALPAHLLSRHSEKNFWRAVLQRFVSLPRHGDRTRVNGHGRRRRERDLGEQRPPRC